MSFILYICSSQLWPFISTDVAVILNEAELKSLKYVHINSLPNHSRLK